MGGEVNCFGAPRAYRSTLLPGYPDGYAVVFEACETEASIRRAFTYFRDSRCGGIASGPKLGPILSQAMPVVRACRFVDVATDTLHVQFIAYNKGARAFGHVDLSLVRSPAGAFQGNILVSALDVPLGGVRSVDRYTVLLWCLDALKVASAVVSVARPQRLLGVDKLVGPMEVLSAMYIGIASVLDNYAAFRVRRSGVLGSNARAFDVHEDVGKGAARLFMLKRAGQRGMRAEGVPLWSVQEDASGLREVAALNHAMANYRGWHALVTLSRVRACCD